MDIPKGTRAVDYRLNEGDTAGVCTTGDNKGRVVIVSRDKSAEVLLPQICVFDEAVQTQREEVRTVVEGERDLSDRSIENMSMALVDEIIKGHGAEMQALFLAALSSKSFHLTMPHFPAPSFLAFNDYKPGADGGHYARCEITPDMERKIEERRRWRESLEKASSELLTRRMLDILGFDKLDLDPPDFRISLLLRASPVDLSGIIIPSFHMNTRKILDSGWRAPGADVISIKARRFELDEKKRRAERDK